MRRFATRSDQSEWMDAADVDYATFNGCLHDLAAVNRWTLAYRPTLAFLAHALGSLSPGRRFTLLDVGFGQGDMLRAIHAWAIRRGLEPDLIGIDLSPWSAAAAQTVTPPTVAIDYRTGDVFDFTPDRPIDIVISSLVTHHMTDAQIVRFLCWMDATATRGWFVNDLHRHWLAFYGFKALAWVMRWHPFVQHDGPISVARSFRRGDWNRLLHEAALDEVAVRWHLPFRLCVERIR